jgi:A/G-specific adenine glycosylase
MDPGIGVAAIRERDRQFAADLIRWYERSHRDLPWRGTSEPWNILVSEIMLQQTRAQVVVPFYQRFLERFPTPATLAAAPESDVLTLWSGLGYYSRARNLRRVAGEIARSGFPRDRASLLRLPGVGPYTAAAVASIAFGEPVAVLDGNVLRVISRVTNDASDIAAAATRARFRAVVQELLDRHRAGAFNQALMELGATICLPGEPQCGQCPVAMHCQAHRRGTAAELPIKLSRQVQQSIAHTLALVERSGTILLWQRGAGERRMSGFWELPSPDELPDFRAHRVLGTFRHTITHHRYTLTLLAGSIRGTPAGFHWFRRDELSDIPVSTITRKALALAARVSELS